MCDPVWFEDSQAAQRTNGPCMNRREPSLPWGGGQVMRLRRVRRTALRPHPLRPPCPAKRRLRHGCCAFVWAKLRASRLEGCAWHRQFTAPCCHSQTSAHGLPVRFAAFVRSAHRTHVILRFPCVVRVARAPSPRRTSPALGLGLDRRTVQRPGVAFRHPSERSPRPQDAARTPSLFWIRVRKPSGAKSGH